MNNERIKENPQNPQDEENESRSPKNRGQRCPKSEQNLDQIKAREVEERKVRSNEEICEKF